MFGNDLLNKQIDRQLAILMQFMHEDCNGIINLSEGNNYELFKKMKRQIREETNYGIDKRNARSYIIDPKKFVLSVKKNNRNKINFRGI